MATLYAAPEKMKKQDIMAYGLTGIAAFLWLTQTGRDIAAKLGSKIMQISDSGLRLIAGFEGFSATPYPDAQGQSIGFGHFIKPGEEFTEITEAEGYALLHQDAASADAAVNRLVTVPLTQNQHDALVSLVYNIGEGNFQISTMLRLINAGNYNSAAAQFDRWDQSQGVVLGSLQDRRADEKALFLT